MHFQVYAIKLWRVLIEEGKETLHKENLSILLKRIKTKGWNRKIGMLLGPGVEVALLKECEKELVEHYNNDISYFEIKKKVEKGGTSAAKCLVLHAIESKA